MKTKEEISSRFLLLWKFRNTEVQINAAKLSPKTSQVAKPSSQPPLAIILYILRRESQALHLTVREKVI